MPMPDYLSAREVADTIGCRPRDVSDLLYSGELDTRFCPLIGAKMRLIPTTLLPEIVRSLKRKGRKLHPLYAGPNGDAPVFEAPTHSDGPEYRAAERGDKSGIAQR